jgi:hypothetical protein
MSRTSVQHVVAPQPKCALAFVHPFCSLLHAACLPAGADNESKKLAMSLGIKALPTFHLYKNTKVVDSMTGAKVGRVVRSDCLG